MNKRWRTIIGWVCAVLFLATLILSTVSFTYDHPGLGIALAIICGYAGMFFLISKAPRLSPEQQSLFRRWRADPSLMPCRVKQNRRVARACIMFGGLLHLGVGAWGLSSSQEIAVVLQPLPLRGWYTWFAVLFGLVSLLHSEALVSTVVGRGCLAAVYITWIFYYIRSVAFWEQFFHLNDPDAWISLGIPLLLCCVYVVPLVLLDRERNALRAAQQPHEPDET
jgi:hypothetical protein